MITLHVSNKNAFVWNADDWLNLRENYRIVGNLIGCIASLPRQDSVRGLPLSLLPEEVTLLLEKKLVKLVSYDNISQQAAENAKEKFNEYKNKIRQEQISYYEEERKKRVVDMIDRIIEGKRRKLSTTKAKKDEENSDQDPEIDKDTILKNELEKAGNIPEASTLIQTFTSDVWNKDAVSNELQWTFPNCKDEKVRYLIFKDLWEKGYYITCAQKFGGDFLVYPGDPIRFHAQFIVVCFDKDYELTASDIVTYGRLGSSTRKTLVIGSLLDDSTVSYQSLTWADIN